jgi:hypothetical protein
VILLILDFIDRGCAKEVVRITAFLFKASAHIAKFIPQIEKDLVSRSHFRSLKLKTLLILFVQHLVFFLASKSMRVVIVLIVVVAEGLVLSDGSLRVVANHLHFLFIIILVNMLLV